LGPLRTRLGLLLPFLFIGALFLYAAWPWLPFPARGGSPRVIVFYGFSILGEVMNNGVFPAFQKEWREKTEEQIEFAGSFAGSGTVTNQVIMGVPAQIALLSLDLDAERLRHAGVISGQSWRGLPFQGVVNRTPFIILVRPGNPKSIHSFEDLARPGMRVVHPDPLTSGGANWAIMAEYGAGFRNSGGVEAGSRLLLGIWRNVVAQAASARAARTQFENGFGDALITYEQEVLWDKTRGRLRGEIIYPASTILSEHTLVKIERNIAPSDRALVDAFASFLWSDSAQKIFVQYGFRSVHESLDSLNPGFRSIRDPFRIDAFGGWQTAKKEVVDEIWKQKVLPELGR
jgi:sulfate/thiosulfate transport system substrate-binding protein